MQCEYCDHCKGEIAECRPIRITIQDLNGDCDVNVVNFCCWKCAACALNA
jgi:hypothetical protein